MLAEMQEPPRTVQNRMVGWCGFESLFQSLQGILRADRYDVKSDGTLLCALKYLDHDSFVQEPTTRLPCQPQIVDRSRDSIRYINESLGRLPDWNVGDRLVTDCVNGGSHLTVFQSYIHPGTVARRPNPVRNLRTGMVATNSGFVPLLNAFTSSAPPMVT